MASKPKTQHMFSQFNTYTKGDPVRYLATGDLATVISVHDDMDGQYVTLQMSDGSERQTVPSKIAPAAESNGPPPAYSPPAYSDGYSSDSSASSSSSGSSRGLAAGIGGKVLAKFKDSSRSYKPAVVVRDEGIRGLRLLFDGYEDTIVVPHSRIRSHRQERAQRRDSRSTAPSSNSSACSSTRSFTLPRELATALIGRGGEVSKSICRQTQCRLTVMDQDHSNNQRVELKGDLSSLPAAVLMCHELIGKKIVSTHGVIRQSSHDHRAHDIDAALYLPIPNTTKLVGAIIGKGGAVKKRILNESGAKFLQIEQKPQNPTAEVTLMGTPHQCRAAQQLVLVRIGADACQQLSAPQQYNNSSSNCSEPASAGGDLGSNLQTLLREQGEVLAARLPALYQARFGCKIVLPINTKLKAILQQQAQLGHCQLEDRQAVAPGQPPVMWIWPAGRSMPSNASTPCAEDVAQGHADKVRQMKVAIKSNMVCAMLKLSEPEVMGELRDWREEQQVSMLAGLQEDAEDELDAVEQLLIKVLRLHGRGTSQDEIIQLVREKAIRLPRLISFVQRFNSSEQSAWQDVVFNPPADCGRVPKTIVVLGETGAGKSTLLNAMLNVAQGVRYNDPVRYRLMQEQGTSQAESQTQAVAEYRVHGGCLGPGGMRVIDTPGFGDTSGMQRDEEITRGIYQHLEQLEEIHAVCFVVPASAPRLTMCQRYIISKVLTMFGSDARDNIFLLVTFADGADAQVLSAVQAVKEFPYSPTRTFQCNNSALFAQPHERNEYSRNFWEMGVESLTKFFSELTRIAPFSLSQTREVIDMRERLENFVVSITPQVTLGLGKVDSLTTQLQEVQAQKQRIDSCGDYNYTDTVQKVTKMNKAAGTYNTQCRQCSYDCHRNCAFSNDDDKAKCCAMDSNGNCTICPSKCHWTQHSNLSYYFEWSTETVQRVYAAKQSQYNAAKSGLSQSEQLIERLLVELYDVQSTTQNLMASIKDAQEQLNHIALQPTNLSMVDYLHLLIEQEKLHKRSHFQQRIAHLTALIEQHTLHGEIIAGKFKMWSAAVEAELQSRGLGKLILSAKAKSAANTDSGQAMQNLLSNNVAHMA